MAGHTYKIIILAALFFIFACQPVVKPIVNGNKFLENTYVPFSVEFPDDIEEDGKFRSYNYDVGGEVVFRTEFRLRSDDRLIFIYKDFLSEGGEWKKRYALDIPNLVYFKGNDQDKTLAVYLGQSGSGNILYGSVSKYIGDDMRVEVLVMERVDQYEDINKENIVYWKNRNTGQVLAMAAYLEKIYDSIHFKLK